MKGEEIFLIIAGAYIAIGSIVAIGRIASRRCHCACTCWEAQVQQPLEVINEEGYYEKV